ncbi:MAG: RNA polymerase sigma factor SigZ [Cyclobacteriaceae bacterium]
MTEKELDIWNELNQKLWNFIYSKTKDREVANDLFQDTFLKVHAHVGSLKDEKRFASWIFTIARNLVIDFFRESNKAMPDLINETDEESLNEKLSCCLVRFIEQLPDKYSEALLLSEIEQISQKELAIRLNISYSGAKSRVQRAREKLKQAFLDCCVMEADKYGNILGIRESECKVDCS